MTRPRALMPYVVATVLATACGPARYKTSSPGRVSIEYRYFRPWYVRDGVAYEASWARSGLLPAVSGNPRATTLARASRRRSLATWLIGMPSAACLGLSLGAAGEGDYGPWPAIGLGVCGLGLITTFFLDVSARRYEQDAINAFNDDARRIIPTPTR